MNVNIAPRTTVLSKPMALQESNDVKEATETLVQKNVLSSVNLAVGMMNMSAVSMSASDVINLIDRYFESLKKTAENLGVTEEEMQQAEQRIEEQKAEELRQIQDDLRDKKIDVEEALKRMQSILADSKAMQVFEANKAQVNGLTGFV